MSDDDNRQEESGQGNTPGSSQTGRSRKKRRAGTNRNRHGSLRPGKPQAGARCPGAVIETSTASLEADDDPISDIVMRINGGLKAVSTASKTSKAVPAPPKERLTYEQYAAFILSTAERWSQDAQNSVWWTKFLAGSISFAGRSLPACPADQEVDNPIPKRSRSEVARWRTIAEFSSMLIMGLYPCWKEKAFLIPHAFAGE